LGAIIVIILLERAKGVPKLREPAPEDAKVVPSSRATADDAA
jgi:hypothetical protein